MKELTLFCKDLKKNFKPRPTDPKKPVSVWNEYDFLKGKVVDAFVIILKTRGCSWAHKSGCSMCGYFNDTLWDDISKEDMLSQFENAMHRYSGQKFVKIFTSGSFFEEKEVAPIVQESIFNKLKETTEKISVESRPEFITDKRLSRVNDIITPCNLEIGIGLETANDYVRENCLNKGFTFKDYTKAVKIIKGYDFDLKTYVLIKPPFLTEKESIRDSVETVKKIKDETDMISFNPVNVQKNTFVNYLWMKKRYRPPWLFSVLEILKESKKIVNTVIIKCDISGGGSTRGAHNCKICDRKFLDSISSFSLSQDVEVFSNLDCECKERWLDQIDIEDLGFGSLSNIYK